MSDTLAGLQFMGALFLAILGLGMVFRGASGEVVLGAFLATLGLSFLASIWVSVRRAS